MGVTTFVPFPTGPGGGSGWIAAALVVKLLAANDQVGIGTAAPAASSKLDVDASAGGFSVAGSFRNGGLELSGGTALFLESGDGSTAPVSGPATGRFRYVNAGLGAWQFSKQGGAYADLATVLSPLTTKSSNSAILPTDTIILVDTSGGPFNLTLPNPAPLSGKLFYIFDATGSLPTNKLTLQRFAAEKISGLAASKVFQTAWGAWIVTTNGTDWFVL